MESGKKRRPITAKEKALVLETYLHVGGAADAVRAWLIDSDKVPSHIKEFYSNAGKHDGPTLRAVRQRLTKIIRSGLSPGKHGGEYQEFALSDFALVTQFEGRAMAAQDQPTLSAPQVQPAQTVVEIQPIQTAAPIQPAQTTSPVPPVQTAAQAQPIQTVIEMQPNQTAPVQPVQTAAQVQPVQTVVEIQPVQAAASIQPVQTAVRVQPFPTGIQVQPLQTAAPVQPVQTGTPIQPVQTAIQVQPVLTGAQVQPVQTAAPVQPAVQIPHHALDPQPGTSRSDAFAQDDVFLDIAEQGSADEIDKAMGAAQAAEAKGTKTKKRWTDSRELMNATLKELRENIAFNTKVERRRAIRSIK